MSNMSSPWSHIESTEAHMEFFTCSELAHVILGTSPKPSFVWIDDIEHSFEQREFIEDI